MRTEEEINADLDVLYRERQEVWKKEKREFIKTIQPALEELKKIDISKGSVCDTWWGMNEKIYACISIMQKASNDIE